MVFMIHESDGDKGDEDSEKDVDLKIVERWLKLIRMGFRRKSIDIDDMIGGALLFHLFCSFKTCHLQLSPVTGS